MGLSKKEEQMISRVRSYIAGKINGSLVLLSLVAMLFSAPGLAESEEEEAKRLFDKATAAYSEDQYQLAVKGFLRAQEKGLRSGELFHYLGLSYYRLKSYDLAYEAFLEASRFVDYESISYYNLGLIAARIQDEALARTWFEKAYYETEDAELKGKVAIQLDQINASPIIRDVSGRPWEFSFAAKTGGDSHMVYHNTDTVQGRSATDIFHELYITGTGQLTGDGNMGLWMEASAFALEYLDQNEFDATEYQLGLNLGQVIRGWKTDVGAYGGASFLGNEAYLQNTTMNLRAQHRMSKSAEFFVRYRSSYIIAMLPRYKALQGWRRDAKAEVLWKQGDSELLLSYMLELNNREDMSSGTEYWDYSPARQLYSVVWTGKKSDTLTTEIGFQYRYSLFRTPYVFSDASSNKRFDSRLRGHYLMKYQEDEDWYATLEFSLTNNASNISDYDYTRGQIAVGVAWEI